MEFRDVVSQAPTMSVLLIQHPSQSQKEEGNTGERNPWSCQRRTKPEGKRVMDNSLDATVAREDCRRETKVEEGCFLV